LIFLVLILVPPVSAVLMNEGDMIPIQVGDDEYTLKLVVVSDRQEKAIFSWRGELSKALREREKHRFSDGSLLMVGHILVDEAGDNPDMVDVYFGVGSGVSRSAFRTSTEGRISGFAFQEAIDNLFDTLFKQDEPQLPQQQSPFQSSQDVQRSQDECITLKNCDDSNPCTVDECGGNPKKCFHNVIDGCPVNDECLAPGTSLSIDAEDFYCDGREWILKKELGELCLENSHCKSDTCESGKCMEIVRMTLNLESPKQVLVAEPQPTWWQRFLAKLGLY